MISGTKSPPKPLPLLRAINPVDWEGVEVPEREWIVPDYVPHKIVTLLSGDGATGKSLLALQLAVGRALALEWIGLLPEPGRTLILSAEDDADEMNRRLNDVRKFYKAGIADLGDIRLVDLVGEDSVLGALMRGKIEPAATYHALDAYLTGFKPGLTVLDVLADMFEGDENNRAQVRQFIGLIKQLARKHSCAFLLLAHPSLTDMNTGTGTSGSTGWNNAVRSRIYFQTAKASDGTEPNKNLRTFQGMKSNYGEPGSRFNLEWKNGLFVRVAEVTGLDKLAAEKKADEAFLKFLKRFNDDVRNVSDSAASPSNYAPKVFADLPDNQGLTSAALKGAMERLFSRKEIKVETVGPRSRQTRRLVIS